jgi:hypothetical protein
MIRIRTAKAHLGGSRMEEEDSLAIITWVRRKMEAETVAERGLTCFFADACTAEC